MKTVLMLICIVVATFPVSFSHAASPELQTPSPVIFLADNLDEKDKLGWCIDTLGRGLSDKLQAHSCKPRGGDVQFSFDLETGQIRSVAFPGLCASYSGETPLDLITCEDTAAQSFVYDQSTMTLRLKSNEDSCLVVGKASRSAGPFMSRTLKVAVCKQTDTLLKTWVIKP